MAGGIAGISIDFALFPVDSIKTRLQEAKNVSKYRGFLSAMLASFPCAAVFWCSYEFSKYELKKHTTGYININIQHMLAAATGEICQALVRNPFEVVKQNLQVGKYKNMLECGIDIFKHKSIGGFYSGYLSFIMREIPFSSIQFPFYEMLKLVQIKLIAFRTGQNENIVQIPSLINGLNGSIAGSFSGFIVTPFDVAKTRLLGAGIRMMYLGVGGFAFFGIYEKIKQTLINKFE